MCKRSRIARHNIISLLLPLPYRPLEHEYRGRVVCHFPTGLKLWNTFILQSLSVALQYSSKTLGLKSNCLSLLHNASLSTYILRASMLKLKVNKQHSEIHRAPCLHQAMADLYSRLLSTSGNLGSVLAAMAAENHLWNIQDFNLLCFQFNLTRASQKTWFPSKCKTSTR